MVKNYILIVLVIVNTNLISQVEWSGTTSTDWNTGSNWIGNIVPTVTDNVIIPDVSSASGNSPIITLATNLGNVNINTNASLEIIAGITLNNSIINNGTVTLKDGAYLDDFTNSGANYNGNIIVETISANGVANDQRYISSAVNYPDFSEIADDLNGPWGTGAQGINDVPITVDDCTIPSLTIASNYGNLFEYDESIVTSCSMDGWIVRSSGALENARGYSAYITNDDIFEFEGTPNTGNISIATTFTNSGVIDAEGWQLLGNPYPSPISRNDLITAGLMDINYYVTSGYYQGAYFPYLPNSNIAVSQGFKARVGCAHLITFTNEMRNTGSSTWHKSGTWFDHKLEVSVQGTNYADKTILFYNNIATSNYEPMYDVSKRVSLSGHPTLATFNSSKNLALNGMSVDDITETVPLNLYSGSDDNFTLSFEGMNTFPTKTTIYLKDILLNTIHDISIGDYNFSANTSDVAERFEIVFIPEIKIIKTEVDCEGNKGNLVLNSTLGISNRTFELTTSTETFSGDLSSLDIDLDEGSYTLIVTDEFNGIQEYLVIIESAEAVIADFNITNSELEVDEFFDLDLNSLSINNFQWDFGDGFLSNIENPSYSYSQIGFYDLKLTVENDECADDKTIQIKVSQNVTAINDVSDYKLTIHPNPVKDILYINNNEDIKVEILNILGELIISSNSKEINMENIISGIYFVNIYNTKRELQSITKIVKK